MTMVENESLLMLHGKVTAGKKLGRAIGFPTANIYPSEDVSCVEMGVYFSQVYIDDLKFYGISNVGVRPSVEDGGRANAETFIFNFNQDIYDKEICLELVKFHRREQHFDSIDGLKNAIAADVSAAKAYFAI